MRPCNETQRHTVQPSESRNDHPMNFLKIHFNKPNFLWIFLILLSLTSCRKDYDKSSENTQFPGNQPYAVTVNGSVMGMVLNQNSVPMSGAVVKAGNHQTTTNTDGIYVFHNIPLNQKGMNIRASINGFWSSSRVVYPRHNHMHHVTHTMLQRFQTGQFSAADGGEVDLSDGTSLVFGPNSIAQSTGELYSGTVSVDKRRLNPDNPLTVRYVPGMRGINQDQQEVALQSYGILAVALQTPSGQPLNLAENQTATITFPVPQSMAGSAPATLGLYRLDEVNGQWLHEGEAQLQGSSYVGEVSHFSYWGIFDDFDGVMLEGTLVNQAGAPVPNTTVTILDADGPGWETTQTDADGNFNVLVPENLNLNLMVSNLCNVTIYAQALGSISSDTDLGNITVNESEAGFSQISGNLVNCDGNPVSLASVQICWQQGCQSLMVMNGSFDVAFSWCDATAFTVSVFDFGSGETAQLTVNADNTINLGTVQLCDNPADEFINFTIDGVNVALPNPYQSIVDNQSRVNAQNSSYSFEMRWPVEGVTNSVFSNSEVQWQYSYYTTPDTSLQFQYASCGLGECENLTFTLTQVEAVGGYIEGTFEGTLDFSNGFQGVTPNAPLSGSFRVLRSQ
ncbi:MAG: carboxypeptidase regulatory-like domain-containing protein [Cryomorphaceae bacterium]|nr:MAG: carboxypeptidase regulatory-like domain-containing protein [Cryomorphaceae bacterium]